MVIKLMKYSTASIPFLHSDHNPDVSWSCWPSFLPLLLTLPAHMSGQAHLRHPAPLLLPPDVLLPLRPSPANLLFASAARGPFTCSLRTHQTQPCNLSDPTKPSNLLVLPCNKWWWKTPLLGVYTRPPIFPFGVHLWMLQFFPCMLQLTRVPCKTASR